MFLVIVVFILIFSFLIISHEFGHFLVAKKMGIKVEEFGIGYPPRIFGKKIGETIYSVNWIPFGGFVKILGENPDKENIKDPRSFSNRPPRQKAAVLLAGVIINFLTAVILFYFLLGINGFQTYQGQIFNYQFPFGQQTNYVVISGVIKNSPAEKAGIRPFDLVIRSDSREFRNPEELISFTNENKGKEVKLLLKNIHNQEERWVEIKPRINPPEDQGAMGVMLSEVSVVSYKTLPEKIFVGFLHPINLGHFSFFAMGHLIKDSIASRSIGPISTSVSGPVGILAFTKLSMAGGAWQVFYFIAAIALALGIINILPIPAADGGRLVFVLYEAIFKKGVPAKIERGVNLVGFFLLVILLFLVSIKDIRQFKDVLF